MKTENIIGCGVGRNGMFGAAQKLHSQRQPPCQALRCFGIVLVDAGAERNCDFYYFVGGCFQVGHLSFLGSELGCWVHGLGKLANPAWTLSI